MTPVQLQAKSPSVIHLQPQEFIFLGYTPDGLATFGENVKRLRKRAGLKGVELAKKLAVTPPVVSGWENNRTGLPETPTLLKVAKALRCSIEELLKGVDAEYDAVSGATPSTVDEHPTRQQLEADELVADFLRIAEPADQTLARQFVGRLARPVAKSRAATAAPASDRQDSSRGTVPARRRRAH